MRLYDARFDNDTSLAGGGDHFTADLYSLWYNLRRMYVDASLYGGDYAGVGLYFCDYVSYYLNVRNSTAAVGLADHDAKVSSISDLIYNNNIACFLPTPCASRLSIPLLDRRSAARRPRYREHMARIPALVPRPWR